MPSRTSHPLAGNPRGDPGALDLFDRLNYL
jgi:hypothetical protein